MKNRKRDSESKRAIKDLSIDNLLLIISAGMTGINSMIDPAKQPTTDRNFSDLLHGMVGGFYRLRDYAPQAWQAPQDLPLLGERAAEKLMAAGLAQHLPK